jgi:DNA-binding XRE family transcriptional regulator
VPDVEPQAERDRSVVSETPKPVSRTRPKAGTHPNNVRKLRQRAMMSKAELARRAGVSPLTIDRVESGCPCRMDTKRKILEALGLQPSKAEEVFPDVANG